MKKFIIEIEGKSPSDVADALDEVKKWIEKGFATGHGANEDGEYLFRSSGSYEKECQKNNTFVHIKNQKI